MKLSYPELECIFDFSPAILNTLVIENPNFMCKLLTDIKAQIEGFGGAAVLSERNVPIQFSKNAELIDSILGFSINQKSLINKISATLFNLSVNGDFYLRSSAIISDIEKLIDEMSFDFPCSITESKLNFENVIKSAGIEITDDYENGLERFLDYMELVREFDRDKLFIFVNMRSFYSQNYMELFSETVIKKELKVLLVDNFAYQLIKNEKRVVIDNDLCEIYIE